jgi:PhnB protein
MKVESYLFFDGQCEEALEFYKQKLGAEVTALFRFKDSPDPSGTPPGGENKIMHANFRVGETILMASDGHCTGKATFAGFAQSISVATDAEAERLFAALSDGGNVAMPLAQTFFSSRFGMVADRFGVMWMVLVYNPEQK